MMNIIYTIQNIITIKMTNLVILVYIMLNFLIILYCSSKINFCTILCFVKFFKYYKLTQKNITYIFLWYV